MAIRKQSRRFGARYLIRNTCVIFGFGLLLLVLWYLLPTFHTWIFVAVFICTIISLIAVEQYGFRTFTAQTATGYCLNVTFGTERIISLALSVKTAILSGIRGWKSLTIDTSRDNNTLHTEPRAARLLETMIFAAAR